MLRNVCDSPAAITRYHQGHLTAKGLLCFYFEIKLKPGWEMRKSPKDIYTELGISRAAFYRAYSALIEEGIIEGEDPDLQKLVIKRPVSDLRQQSQSVDSESQIGENRRFVSPDATRLNFTFFTPFGGGNDKKYKSITLPRKIPFRQRQN